MSSQHRLSFAIALALATSASVAAAQNPPVPSGAGEPVQLEAVIVRPQLEQQQRAIEEKRSSDAITDTVASDTMGQYPDKNVGEALSRVANIKTANVYGVPIPGADGKAGMAAITTEGEVDFAGLYKSLAAKLPSYAVPIFIRVQPEAETTGTFKYRKVELVADGFDPDKVNEPLWMFDPEEAAYPAIGRFIEVLETVRKRHPDAVISVVGISMGASVAMTAFGADHPPKADRLSLSGPGLRGNDLFFLAWSHIHVSFEKCAQLIHATPRFRSGHCLSRRRFAAPRDEG